MELSYGTGQARLTAKPDDADAGNKMNAAAKGLDALGIAFTRATMDGKDTIVLDESIVVSFRASVPPREMRATSAALVKKQDDEKARPFLERLEQQNKDLAEEKIYLADLDKRFELLTRQLLQSAKGGPAGGGIPLGGIPQFNGYDVMLMSDPFKQTPAYKKAYALFNVMAEKAGEAGGAPPQNMAFLQQGNNLHFFQLFAGDAGQPGEPDRPGKPGKPYIPPDPRYLSIMSAYRYDARMAFESPGSGSQYTTGNNGNQPVVQNVPDANGGMPPAPPNSTPVVTPTGSSSRNMP